MIHLIIGGSGSGKSEFAENEVVRLGDNRRIYIATMIPYDEESDIRIERHRKMREKKAFTTIERPTDIAGIDIPQNSTVLLECVSNLVANELYDASGAGVLAESWTKSSVKRLSYMCKDLVIVSNDIFGDDTSIYDYETRRYIDILAHINCYIAGLADRVTEVVYGIPISYK